jgi:NADPH:quinone reductase-like Zn-dependent oxidoreductase
MDRQYDLIFAANGDRSIFDYNRALAPGGILVVAGGSMAQLFQTMLLGPWLSMFGDKKMSSMLSQPTTEDLTFIKELIEAGKIKPIVDRRYSLSETAEACRYLDEGHAKGKIVITM